MGKLDDAAIRQALDGLKGWTLEGNAIKRQYTLASFPDAIAFVTRLAFDAEAADHHPDIAFGWGYAEIAFTTHDRGGITDVDFALAEEVNLL